MRSPLRLRTAGFVVLALLLAMGLAVGAVGARPAGISEAEYRALVACSGALSDRYQPPQTTGAALAELRALRNCGEALNQAYGTPTAGESDLGFDWRDAGIGAGAATGFALLAVAAGLAVHTRVRAVRPRS